jgi:hypothetical protein
MARGATCYTIDIMVPSPLDGLFTTPDRCHGSLVLWLLPCLDLLRWLGSSRLVSMLLHHTPASPRTCCICGLLVLR